MNEIFVARKAFAAYFGQLSRFQRSDDEWRLNQVQGDRGPSLSNSLFILAAYHHLSGRMKSL